MASVLKQFLRELPDPVLTNNLMLRFEEVSASSNPQKRIEGMKTLLAELPECNRYVLVLLEVVFLLFVVVLKELRPILLSKKFRHCKRWQFVKAGVTE